MATAGLVVLRKPLANLVCGHPHYGISVGVVNGFAPEDFNSQRTFLDAVFVPAFQSMLDESAKQDHASSALSEGGIRKNLVSRPPDGGALLRSPWALVHCISNSGFFHLAHGYFLARLDWTCAIAQLRSPRAASAIRIYSTFRLKKLIAIRTSGLLPCQFGPYATYRLRHSSA